MTRQHPARPEYGPDLLTVEERTTLWTAGEHVAGLHDKFDSVHRAQLEAHADAFARGVHASNFDPGMHEDDRVRAECLNHHVDRLHRVLAPAVDFARSRVSAAGQAVADHAHGLLAPVPVDLWLRLIAAAFLTTTICVTVHDQFFATLDDDLLAWALSLGLSAVGGVYLVWAILSDAHHSGEHTAHNWVGLLSGAAVGLGFGVLRIAYAVHPGDYYFAVALTIVEWAIVASLEATAERRRGAYREWHEHEIALAPHRAELTDAAAARERAEAYKHECESEIAHHLDYIEWRRMRHVKAADIRDAALGVLTQAYDKRIACNHQERAGIRRVA